MPQVGSKDLGVRQDENLSVPIGTKGYQRTDQKRRAQVFVNQDLSREKKNQNKNPSRNQRRKIRKERLENKQVAALEMARNDIAETLVREAVKDAMARLVNKQTNARRERMEVQKPQSIPSRTTKRHQRWAAQKLREQAKEKVAVHMECVARRLKRTGHKNPILTPKSVKLLQTFSAWKKDRRQKHQVRKDLSRRRRDQRARQRKSKEYMSRLFQLGRSLRQRLDTLKWKRKRVSACKLTNKTCLHLPDMTTDQANARAEAQDEQVRTKAKWLEEETARQRAYVVGHDWMDEKRVETEKTVPLRKKALTRKKRASSVETSTTVVNNQEQEEVDEPGAVHSAFVSAGQARSQGAKQVAEVNLTGLGSGDDQEHPTTNTPATSGATVLVKGKITW
jgi:hypothetical protein